MYIFLINDEENQNLSYFRGQKPQNISSPSFEWVYAASLESIVVFFFQYNFFEFLGDVDRCSFSVQGVLFISEIHCKT